MPKMAVYSTFPWRVDSLPLACVWHPLLCAMHMVAIGHWPLADLVNVVAQGLVLPDATPGTVMQLLDLEISEHIGTCLVAASLRPTNGAIPAGLGAQWPRRWPPTILEPTSHNEDHLFKLTAERCLALLVCKVMARVDQLIHSDATPPTIADEGFGEWRPWSHHQVSHERSPLLRLFTT